MKLSPFQLKILITLAVSQFTHVLDFMIIMPLGPQLMRTFNIDTQYFSVLVSSFNIAAGLSALFGVFIIDRFERKSFFLLNYLGFLIGTLCCAFAPSFYFLLSARIVTGVFGGLASSLLLSIISDTINPEKRGFAMGIVMTAFSVASVIGVPLGLYLATTYNWHMPFLLVVAVGLIELFLIAKFIPTLNAHLTNKKVFSFIAPFKGLFNTSSKIYAFCLTASLMLGWFIIIPFISPYMIGNVGFTENDLPLIYFVGGAFTLFASPLVGKLSDIYGSKKIFYIAIGLSVLVIITLTNLPQVNLSIALAVTSMLFLCAGARMIPAQSTITKVVEPEIRGGFMSFNSFVTQAASGLASLCGGLIIIKQNDNSLLHYDLLGYIAVAFSLLSIYFMYKIKVLNT